MNARSSVRMRRKLCDPAIETSFARSYVGQGSFVVDCWAFDGLDWGLWVALRVSWWDWSLP